MELEQACLDHPLFLGVLDRRRVSLVGVDGLGLVLEMKSWRVWRRMLGIPRRILPALDGTATHVLPSLLPEPTLRRLPPIRVSSTSNAERGVGL